MAKRIIMIAPFEVLTGNLSGQQRLEYAENNNPAYEAPNGSMGARNYKTRYIGARRADGTSYFSVRRKSTAVLNGKTRRQMAVLGSLQDIIAKMKTTNVVAGTNYTYHQAAFYSWSYDQKGSAPSIDDKFSITDPAFIKWEKDEVIKMLKYKHESITFRTATGTAVLNNPYCVDVASRIEMKQSIWDKFVGVLGLTSASGNLELAAVNVDSDSFLFAVAASGSSWGATISGLHPNTNYGATFASFAVDASNKVTYEGLVMYLGGTAVADEDDIQDGAKYTTIEP